MPKVYVHQTINSQIKHESKESLTRLSQNLQNLQNKGYILKLKGHDLTTTPEGLKHLVNQSRYRTEEQGASHYFGGTREKISIGDALYLVKEALKPQQNQSSLKQGVSALPATPPAAPQIRLAPISFDEKISELFLAHTEKKPTPEQICVLNDLCTGLSILKIRGISALIPSAAHALNESTKISDYSLCENLGCSESFTELPWQLDNELVKLLISTLPECSPPEGRAAVEVLNTIPATTKAIMLRSCTFCMADLRSANLKNANLDNINLSHSNIEHHENLPQHHLQCSGSTWKNSTLLNTSINDSDFSGAKLIDIELCSIDSQRVNYTDAKLTGANLDRVNFSGSDFSRADLSSIRINHVNFSNTDLTGTTISLAPDFLDEVVREIDHHINHLSHYNEGLLLSINSINPRHEEQRNALMRSVIERLLPLEGDLPVGSRNSLADVLLKEPSYTKDPVIARFIQTQLLPHWMESKNQELLRPDEVDLATVFNLLNASAPDADWSEHRYQVAVNQLLLSANLASNRADLHQSAEKLRTTYLNTPSIKEAASACDAIEENLSKVTYIFTSGNGEQVLALEPELFEKIVFTHHKVIPWNSAYLFTRNAETESFEPADFGNLKEVYAIQPFLNARYAAVTRGEIGKNLVSRVLGNSPHSATFLEAFERNTVKNKLVTPQQQDELYDAFAAHWQVAQGDVHNPQHESRHLRPEHQEQLCQAVVGLGLQDTGPNRAALMLCLSSIFTRYSSSALFGTETESPPAVRLYASALLNEARTLDPSLIDDATANDWQSRLLGIGRAFSCTEILSSMMNTYIKRQARTNSELEEMSLELYPAAWR